MVSIKFLGAAGTVTGSKYLVRGAGKCLLIDCGLFQGERSWREKNWDSPPCDLAEVDAVLLTHAHIDHTGMLPRFSRLGLRCPVYCTKPTLDLSKLVLPDSAHLQEEEAEYRGERGKSRHHPPLPLYTVEDAETVLRYFRSVAVHERIELFPGIFATWRRMGHIIGACSISLEIGGRCIGFSGDVGRYAVPILKDPEPLDCGDLLLIESTYGTTEQHETSPRDELGKIVSETAQRGGVVLIPSFAVGRTQLLLYYLRELKEAHRIPDIPIIIDSPMAADATQVYQSNPADYDDEALGILKRGQHPFSLPKLGFVQSRDESIRLNKIDQPMVVISASGMLTGGRILHHLRNRVGDPRNTVLFVGYQPPGSRGAWLKSGAQTLRIFGQEYAIRAKVKEISGLSAHADKCELLRWAKSCRGRPSKIAVVHGEPEVANIFAKTIGDALGVSARVPAYLEQWDV
ncbi:MAG: MBL fold metallo-hydrolase [Oligoflexia bacterium]|nr:MBL fold metallo-hydrolase [Oligoflexia bacterium]